MDRTQWDRRLALYQAALVLFDADDQWGPLHVATNRMEGSHTAARRAANDAERVKLLTEYGRNYERHTRELERHMAEVYDPLLDAALTLVRTPSPDLAAVRVKHEACNADGFRLLDYEEEEGELFGIIQQDVQRLLGEEAGA